jgi:predicted protein tyrosine phosphatase
MSILVAPLSHLPDIVARRKPARVISVLDPGIPFPELGPSYDDRHLRLAFHDVHSPGPGVVAPSARHIAELLDFLETWDAVECLLVHCRAGIGRSTATAFVAACHRDPRASERRIAIELRRVAPLARPNEAVVKLADAMMQRNGRMWAAIADTGRGLPWLDVHEGEPFELAARFDAESV